MPLLFNQRAEAINVLGGALAECSRQPITGYFRDGYCHASPVDGGSHTVAAQVTEGFLTFSAQRGNDLRSHLDLKGGCKWCLCASRWKEALDAWRRGIISREGVPRVILPATHREALKTVTLTELQAFDAERIPHDPAR